MSTNYYGIPIQAKKEWEERKKASIEEVGSKKGLIPMIEEYYEARKPKTIHIGKSSGGWDFLFNLNKKKYYSTKQKLIDWLKTVQIVDEYKREHSFDEFWNDVVINRTWNGKPVKSHKSLSGSASMYIVIDNLEFLDCEFS